MGEVVEFQPLLANSLLEHTPTESFEKNIYKTCLENKVQKWGSLGEDQVLLCYKNSVSVETQQKKAISQIN